MEILKKIPFFLVLLSVFFCLHGAVENYGFVSFMEVFLVGVSMLVVMAVLFLISLLFTRKILFASLLTFFISIWYFFFGAIHDFIKSIEMLSFLKSYTVILPVLFALTLLWIFFLKKKPFLWPKLVLYFNVLLIIYSLIDAIKLTFNASLSGKQPVAIKFNYNKVSQNPTFIFCYLTVIPGRKRFQTVLILIIRNLIIF